MRIIDWSSDVAEGAVRPGSFASLTLVDVAPEMDPEGVSRIVGFMNAHVERGFASYDEAAEAIADYMPNREKRGASEGLKSYLRLDRSEEQTSELQSLMRNSYAVFCLK